jgi:hypothetical protein
MFSICIVALYLGPLAIVSITTFELSHLRISPTQKLVELVWAGGGGVLVFFVTLGFYFYFFVTLEGFLEIYAILNEINLPFMSLNLCIKIISNTNTTKNLSTKGKRTT